MKKISIFRWFGILLMILALAMVGCEGDDGSDGATGPAGPKGEQGEQGIPGVGIEGPKGDSGIGLVDAWTASPEDLAIITPEIEITDVSIADQTVVSFTVKDDKGRNIVGIDKINEIEDDRGRSGRYIRFTLAKLVQPEDPEGKVPSRYPSYWVPYILSDGRPTYDSVYGGGDLQGDGLGNYTYTFATDVTDVEGVPYEKSLTHRLGGQMGGGESELQPINIVHDFVPRDPSEEPDPRNIAMTSSCNECHDPLEIHGRRREVGYCVTCHNPSLGEFDMAPMVHKIHTAKKVGGEDFSEVTYPQNPVNCRKCHSGDDLPYTPNGDNWKLVPSMIACGSCHSDINFATGANHGRDDEPNVGPLEGNDLCGKCHKPDSIEMSHWDDDGRIPSPMASPNNPELPDGVPEIKYELIEASVNGANQAIIRFRILRDDQLLDLLDLDQDLAAPNRWPSFLLAYALPQGGILRPVDHNNLGENSGQPPSADLGNLVDQGVVSFIEDESRGDHYISTIENAFPGNATLRTVGMQGYFYLDTDGDGEENYALHTPSAVIGVSGDESRRKVVESKKCANCHEWFEGHGGNRVYNMEVCVLCHNPNLSSSGRTLDEPDALDYPEATNNFKDMIHGIHGGEVRETPYTFVRAFRGSGTLYDWSEVTFPGRAENCLTCHLEDTYKLPIGESEDESIAERTLLTTNVTIGEVPAGAEETPALVSEWRESVPNDNDLVITPITASCYACHDGEMAQTHMELNGGLIDVTRFPAIDNETCVICHGEDRSADVNEVHDF